VFLVEEESVENSGAGFKTVGRDQKSPKVDIERNKEEAR